MKGVYLKTFLVLTRAKFKEFGLRRIIKLHIFIIKNDIYDNPDRCDLFFIISQKLQRTNALKPPVRNV
jgi:hypothetical protein